jgi:hypothetical protein
VRSIDRNIKALGPALDYTPIPFMGVEMRRNATRQRYIEEGRIYLRSADSHTAAQEMAKRGKVPPLSVYSGLLGEFWSPPYYQPPTEGNDDEQRPHHDERTDPDGTPGLPAEPDPVQLDPDPGSADWRQWFDATPETEKAPDIDDGGIDDNGGFAGPA